MGYFESFDLVFRIEKFQIYLSSHIIFKSDQISCQLKTEIHYTEHGRLNFRTVIKIFEQAFEFFFSGDIRRRTNQ